MTDKITFYLHGGHEITRVVDDAVAVLHRPHGGTDYVLHDPETLIKDAGVVAIVWRPQNPVTVETVRR